MRYIGRRTFVGLQNYIDVFTRDDIFHALTLSLYYMAGSVIQMALAQNEGIANAQPICAGAPCAGRCEYQPPGTAPAGRHKIGTAVRRTQTCSGRPFLFAPVRAKKPRNVRSRAFAAPGSTGV